MPRELFPGISEFRKVLDACDEYWKENTKARKFFGTAKQLLNQEDITFLKISDYNTNGLAGAHEPRGRDWHKLTKSVGASDKHEGKDGSFGIGKHAPFACSAFRTVFYGTRAKEDKSFAFQGVAKLVTHLDKEKEETQGTGYYGDKEKLRPLFELGGVNEFFGRKKFGTDIFIPGFVYGGDWEERIAVSVIKNFFVSIHEGQLIVEVGDIRIDSTSLPGLMDELVARKDPSGTTGFFKALVDENAHVFYEEDFMGMGRIELNVVVDENLPKQVAMVRRSGMLVYIKKRFRTPLRFSAVFVARGEALNTFLTSLEPPAHDDWEPERHSEDVPYARKVLQQMQAWIVDKIKELSAVSESEEIDPDGIGQFLPDELDETGGEASDPDSKDGEPRPREVDMQVRVVVPSAHETSSADHGGGDGSAIDDADYSGDGEDSDTVNPIEDKTVDEGSGGDGDSGAGENEGPSSTSRVAKVNLSRMRLFCTDAHAGEYILSYTPEVSGAGEIHVNIVGEVGNEAAPLATANDTLSGDVYSILREGVIGSIPFLAGESRQLKITLKENLRCAMEVIAYAS